MSEQKPASREEWDAYWKKRCFENPLLTFNKAAEQISSSMNRLLDQLSFKVDPKSDEAQAFQNVFGRPMQVEDRFSPILIASPTPSLPPAPSPPAFESMNRWSQLEREFKELREKYGEPLGACWTSGTWNYDGHQWYLSASNSRLTAEENERLCGRFGDVAQRAAVYAGHPLLATGLFFWLDLVRAKSPRYRGGGTSTSISADGTTRETEHGSIEELFLASAECCYKLGTEAARTGLEAVHEIRSQSGSSTSLVGGGIEIDGLEPTRGGPESPRAYMGSSTLAGHDEGQRHHAHCEVHSDKAHPTVPAELDSAIRTAATNIPTQPARPESSTLIDQTPIAATAHVPRKRGRPAAIDNKTKDAALAVKARGGTGRDIAKILYETPYPSNQQVKNAPNILKHYQKSASPSPNKS